MNILFVSFLGAFPYHGGGGSWSYVKQLKTGLEELGHQVEVLSPSSDQAGFHQLKRGERINKSSVAPLITTRVTQLLQRRSPELKGWVLSQEIERYTFELASAFFGLDYDVIHVQDVIAARAMSRVKRKNTALVLTLHGCLMADYARSGMIQPETLTWQYHERSEYWGIQSCDRIICPSESLKKDVNEYTRLPEERVHIVPNGLKVEAIQRPMQARAIDGHKTIMICIARLIPEKDHHTLFHSLARLLTLRNDWECWIVGDGPQKAALEQACVELGLNDYVFFLGAREDVPSLLDHADIFVLSSRNENCPFAVIEAMHAGKAIVATNAGGLTELVEDGKTGLLAPVGNSEAFCDQLALLLEKPELMRELALQGRQRAQTLYSMEMMLSRTMDVYQIALSKEGNE